MTALQTSFYQNLHPTKRILCYRQTMNHHKRLLFNPVLSPTLFLVLANSSLLRAEEAMVFPAWTAKITGNLEIQGAKEAATIHYWNQAEDTMTWTWKEAHPGHYRADIQYSLDPSMVGGQMALSIGEQTVTVPAKPTGDWALFRPTPLGVLNLTSEGDLTVTLQAGELPQMANAALPNFAWLSLTPTDEAVTLDTTSHEGAPPAEFSGKSLFNGENFSGWEGNLDWFRIEEGVAIAGSLTQRIPQNEFLATTADYGDFELRLQARLVEGRGNGGVQFRSQRDENSTEMIGYQADVAGSYWGRVYDEHRRRHFLGQPLNEDKMRATLQADGWNDYIIRCQGPRVRVWVNKVLTLDYTEKDETIPRTGKIALQIHSGAPSEAWYRNVKIQRLSAQ
ncbi:3-keto-disaccharide hydrolase [Roseibacillus ishigakijimensis]|uniref:DUF1080 domain-containing protein n=1 Tax=Roseibacillus ishigakijimensis TaxID=454146 RepID=A0A934RLA0_9BACT|nr:DUF1080 domain-containing protein [Roseibacillus ishigakijimensis]MBK1832840.1 DUF1080 domain-containing protein [Roseibacillus ishigakijimensis]